MTAGTLLASTCAPPHRFTADALGGKTLLTVDLPELTSLVGVDLDIGSSQIRLLLPGHSHHSCIQLPKELHGRDGAGSNPEETMPYPLAKFSKKRGQLTISWEQLAQVEKVEKVTLEQTPCTEAQQTGDPALSAEAPRAISGHVDFAWVDLGGQASTSAANSSVACDIDCLDLLHEEIDHILKRCTVEKLRNVRELKGGSVMLDDFNIKGEAALKDGLCCFKVSVSLSWDVLDGIGGFMGVGGKADVELTESETSPCVLVKAGGRVGPQQSSICDWMKVKGAAAISAALNGPSLCEVVSEAAQPRAAALNAPSATTVRAQVEPQCLTEWASTCLRDKFSNLVIRLFGGLATASIFAPRVVGYASIAIRDGKPVCLFDLKADCAWSVVQSGKTVAEGTLTVSEYTPKKGAKGASVQINASPGKKASGQFLAALRTDGTHAVRTLLAHFVDDLQLRLHSCVLLT